MKATDEFERKLINGELDPMMKQIANQVRHKWDPYHANFYEIEDLMQEAYLRIIEVIQADKYDEKKEKGASKQTYMYTCAKNRLIDIELRAQRRMLHAKVIYFPELHEEYENRTKEQNPDETLNQIESILTNMSIAKICEDLEEVCRKKLAGSKQGAPSSELLYKILIMKSEGITEDQIMEETGITMYRLKKIKKIIYEYMKSENYEENVRDVVGGSYERRNDQHQPAQDPGVIRSGGNDSVYNV